MRFKIEVIVDYFPNNFNDGIKEKSEKGLLKPIVRK